jgi:hypothetical protein
MVEDHVPDLVQYDVILMDRGRIRGVGDKIVIGGTLPCSGAVSEAPGNGAQVDFPPAVTF